MHFASRTDAGVHARGQVSRFDQETGMSPDQIRKALNYYMAKDVRIRCAQFVPGGPDGFDPRGEALSRTYAYTFNDARSEPALDRHFVAHVRKPLDAAAMDVASRGSPFRRIPRRVRNALLYEDLPLIRPARSWPFRLHRLPERPTA